MSEIDFTKKSNSFLKRRLNTVKNAKIKLDNIFSKVRNRWNSDRDYNDPDSPRYIYVSRRTGKALKRQDYYKKLAIQYSDLNSEERALTYLIAERESESVKDYVISFIVMDKKSNPSLYPEWVSFKLDDVQMGGGIRLTPHIDLKSMLDSKGSISSVGIISKRIQLFWQRYFSKKNLSFNKYHYEGLDSYIKNVFRKEIKNMITEKLDPKQCVHSIIFKQPNNYTGYGLAQDLIMITPRFKKFNWDDQGEDQLWCRRSFSEYSFNTSLSKLLREYGWIKGQNYTSTYSKD